MKVEIEVPMRAAEGEIFADGLAESLVGKATADGQPIIKAEQVEPGLILTTVLVEIPPELEAMFQPRDLSGVSFEERDDTPQPL